MRKERIFVGSSSEGKKYAEKIIRHINEVRNDYSCVPWWDEFFEHGNVTYSELIEKGPTFDYAIFICTADDYTIRKSDDTFF